MKSLLSVLFSFMCLIRNILIFICPLETFLGSNKNETKFYLYNSSIFINSQKVSKIIDIELNLNQKMLPSTFRFSVRVVNARYV